MSDIFEIIKNKSAKIIGFTTEDEYNLFLKEVYETTKNRKPIIIDDGFHVPTNMQVIISVQQSLKTLDLNNLKCEDIVLTNNVLLNKKIQEAIISILQPFLLKPFNNNITRENFFVKHIVWIYERINQVDFTKNEKPLIIYYGDSNEDDQIHLQILLKIGFDIIYINPRMNNSNVFYKQLDIEDEVIFPNFGKPDKFMLRVSRAKDCPQIQNNVIQTIAKQAKDEFSTQMYKNGAIFKPWQFKKGYTKPLFLNAVLEDIKTYWNQDARFREGFHVSFENNRETVSIPIFFTKINGTQFDKVAYKDFVNFTKDSQLTIFKTSTELLNPSFSKEDMFSLMFVMTYDKVDFDKIKQHKLYKLSRINIDVQKFIIDKFNEFSIQFKKQIQQTDLIYLLASIINCDLEFIKLIENFDFPFRIPKLVIYLKDRETFDLNNSLFIHFLSLIGLDILILSPTGSESIEDNLFNHYLNIITLDEMQFDLSFESLQDYNKKEEKKGFFLKLFG